MVVENAKHSADNRKIWRYLDFMKYMSLLVNGAAFIPRCDKFGDKYEGYYPNIRELLGPDYKPRIGTTDWQSFFRADKNVAQKEDLQLAVHELRQRTFVWCWHLNEGESEAMWQLYLQSAEGVAIVTTVAKLATSLNSSPEYFVLSDVEYRNWDDSSNWPSDTVQPFFLWLPSSDLALARVANRVCQGGHNIPEADIRRRFESGLRNLFQLYRPLLDAWWLYDASELPPAVIAKEEGGKVNVAMADLYEQITRGVEK